MKTELSNEELLRRVIEAQVKGGDPQYGRGKNWEVLDNAVCQCEFEGRYTFVHILAILLNTSGANAAYGNKASEHQLKLLDCKTPIIFNLGLTPIWKIAHQFISDAWDSGEGNNIRAALETAVSFLP